MTRTAKALIALFLAFNGLDVLTTWLGTSMGMPEGNPVAATWLGMYGIWGLVGLKSLSIACVLAVVFPFCRRYPRVWWTVRASNLILAVVVVNNVVAVMG